MLCQLGGMGCDLGGTWRYIFDLAVAYGIQCGMRQMMTFCTGYAFYSQAMADLPEGDQRDCPGAVKSIQSVLLVNLHLLMSHYLDLSPSLSRHEPYSLSGSPRMRLTRTLFGLIN